MWLESFNRMRKSVGMNLDELSEASGVPKGTLAKITAGITRNPSIETVRVLVHAMGYTLGDLDDAREPNILTTDEMGHIKKYRVLDLYGRRAVDGVLDAEYDRLTHMAERESRGQIAYLNCYDLAVSAGTGEPLGDTYYTTRLEIPSQRVPENAHCCVRVNGDSMEPAYKDGDIVFVERLDGSVREGEIGIFALNGEGYLKRLGQGELLSLNPAYAPIPVGEFDDLRCQGRVLGKL